MAKDKDEELPEVEDENVEWSDEPPEDVPEDEELPESPTLVDYSTETAPTTSGGVTYTRGENGKLIAHYE